MTEVYNTTSLRDFLASKSSDYLKEISRTEITNLIMKQSNTLLKESLELLKEVNILEKLSQYNVITLIREVGLDSLSVLKEFGLLENANQDFLYYISSIFGMEDALDACKAVGVNFSFDTIFYHVKQDTIYTDKVLKIKDTQGFSIAYRFLQINRLLEKKINIQDKVSDWSEHVPEGSGVITDSLYTYYYSKSG